MSHAADSVDDAVERLSRRDPTLKWISLNGEQQTDAQLAELVDCLLAHPNAINELYLGNNQLTDETGVKLARYLAASSTIQMLDLSTNLIGEATFLAVAAALRVNSSLRVLYLFNNEVADQTRIDAAFVDALWLNSHRPAYSTWQLYSGDWTDIDFNRLKEEVGQLGHPSLQLLLARLS